MQLYDWLNRRVRHLDLWDIGLIKWSVAAFVLLLAKLWEPILSLPWQAYLVIAIGLVIRPAYKFYFERDEAAAPRLV